MFDRLAVSGVQVHRTVSSACASAGRSPAPHTSLTVEKAAVFLTVCSRETRFPVHSTAEKVGRFPARPHFSRCELSARKKKMFFVLPVAPPCLLSPPKGTDECVDFLQHLSRVTLFTKRTAHVASYSFVIPPGDTRVGIGRSLSSRGG